MFESVVNNIDESVPIEYEINAIPTIIYKEATMCSVFVKGIILLYPTVAKVKTLKYILSLLHSIFIYQVKDIKYW